MAFSSLTLLLVGEDALAEQLYVHLEHRGADLERAGVADALDTIRVAVPDLVIVSSDAAKTDAERIRDGVLGNAAQKTRLLVLCDKALGSRLGTHRHTHLGALESSLGADVIASCIESLCGLIEKQGDAGKQPLRTLIASVQKSHVPASANKPAYSPKKTLQMPIAIATPAIEAAAKLEEPKVEAPKIEAPKIEAPKPIVAAAPMIDAPMIDAPKPIAMPAPAKAIATKVEAPIASLKPAPKIEAPKIEAPKPVAPIASLKPAPKIEAPVASLNPATKIEATKIEATKPAAPIASLKPAPKLDAPVPLAALLAPVSAAPAAVPDDTFEEVSVALSMAPTVPPEPPEPITAPEIVFDLRAALREESLTPTHVEVAVRSAPPEKAAQAAAWLGALRGYAHASTRHASRARAAFMRMPRPQQLALVAAALVCLAGVGLASSGDRSAEPPLAPGSASLHAVSRPAPQAPQTKPQPVAVAQPPAVARAPVAAAAPAPAPIEPATDQDDEALEATHEDAELEQTGIDPARQRADRLVNAGHRLRKQGRWGMAEASYLKALKELPTYGRAIAGLVQVHLGRRDGAEAVRWAKKLVSLQGKPGVHHRLLGDAYALAGDKSAARKAWQNASRLGDRVARERLKK